VFGVDIVTERGDALIIVGERAGQPVGSLVGPVAALWLPDNLKVPLGSLSPRRPGVLPDRRALLDAEGLEISPLAPQNGNVGQDVDDGIVAFRAVLLCLFDEAQAVLYLKLGKARPLGTIPARDSTVHCCSPRL
jgi:hypothetical protein